MTSCSRNARYTPLARRAEPGVQRSGQHEPAPRPVVADLDIGSATRNELRPHPHPERLRSESVVVAASHQERRQLRGGGAQIAVDSHQVAIGVLGRDDQGAVSRPPGLIDELVGHMGEPARARVEPPHGHVGGVDVPGELVVEGEMVYPEPADGELAADVVPLEPDDRRGDRSKVADEIGEPLGGLDIAVRAGAMVPQGGVVADDPVRGPRPRPARILRCQTSSPGGAPACKDRRARPAHGRSG